MKEVATKKASRNSANAKLDFSKGVRGRVTDIFRHDYTITVHHKGYDVVTVVRGKKPAFPLREGEEGHLEAA